MHELRLSPRRRPLIFTCQITDPLPPGVSYEMSHQIQCLRPPGQPCVMEGLSSLICDEKLTCGETENSLQPRQPKAQVIRPQDPTTPHPGAPVWPLH